MKLTHNSSYVNFGPRLVAFFIDKSIWSLPTIFLWWRWVSAVDVENLIVLVVTDTVRFGIPLFLLNLVYYPMMLSKYNATLGKLVVGIEVTTKTDKAISFKWALFREVVAKAVSSFLFGLGYLWILFDKNHQGWHDLLAGTVVKPKDLHVALGILIWVLLLAAIVAGWVVVFRTGMANVALHQSFVQLFSIQ